MAVPSWQPTELLDQIASDPLAVLRNGVGTAPFLIVRLDDFSNDLGIGLAAADEAADRKRFSRAIKSTLQISVGMTEQMRVLGSRDLPPLSPNHAEEAASGARAGFPVPEWLSARCYVVRLSGRSENKAPLAIGRDPSHHVVLQHPSVSATHAYLTLGPQLSLRDANSRNGTLVNRVPIKGTVVPLQLGQRIKFGAVQTVLCSAEDLWHALR